MTELLLFLVGALLLMTLGASVQYYRQLRKVIREYETAKGVVEDVIFGFKRQLMREAEKVSVVASEAEAFSLKSANGLKRVKDLETQLHDLDFKISAVFEAKAKTSNDLGKIDRKVQTVAASQETLTARISNIEKQFSELSRIPEPRVESAIPIKREKALAPLTETELSVLETLALEGPKTSPQIKDRIKLSREHTARLMKKLYEGGYLERDMNTIPFNYQIKKEMAKFLKKTESNT